jgi:hypothetical protein
MNYLMSHIGFNLHVMRHYQPRERCVHWLIADTLMTLFVPQNNLWHVTANVLS